MNNWKTYHIGDFLKRQFESVLIDDFSLYKRITIKTKGQGIGLRDEVEGLEIGTKNQFKVRQGQFLLSKIDAMNGAFGIVPKECDQGIITGNFWTYNIDDKIVCKKYLHLLCLQQVFTDFSLKASEGTTNRKYLRENKFLNLTISLPSLHEQQHIINKAGSVNVKTEAIRLLRHEQIKQIHQLLYSKYIDIIANAVIFPLSDVAPIIRRPVKVEEDKSYPELGIRSFGKGTFHKQALSGIEIGTKKIFQIKAGDLVFSNVFAWEGAIAVAKEEDNNRFGSHRFISCIADKKKVLPDFLCYYFLTPEGLEVINVCSPGGAGRNKTLGLNKLMGIKVPVPSLELQQEFITLLHKVGQAENIRKEQEEELAEVLPALLNTAFKGEILADNIVYKQEKDSVPERKNHSKIPKAASYRNDDLELAMVVALMESRLGNTYGEVGIQKTVFNVEAFNPVLNRKYGFVNYHYGTYSSELKERLKNNPFLGKKAIKGNEVFTISAGYKKNVLAAISDKANKDFIFAVNNILDIYTSPFIGKHTDKIELLNTVTKLIIDLQTTDPNVIFEGMKKWDIKQQGFKTKADKFNLTDTIKTIELLKSNGLIEKLLQRNNFNN